MSISPPALASETFEVANEQETRALAAKFALELQAGDVVALRGDLGAGKTSFVRALCHALGCRDTVTSPTFTLVNVYASGPVPLYHFDFYRLTAAGEAASVGFDDYLQEDGICLIEWPEQVEAILPADTRHVQIVIPDFFADPGRRIIHISKQVTS